MAYVFTQAEKTQIEAALSACTGLTRDTDGTYLEVRRAGTNAVPLYQTLSNIIGQKLGMAGAFDPFTLAGLKSAKLWLDVAIGANGNTGIHSEFIRTFTNTQGRLRLGAGFDADQMQTASNVVARNLANGLVRGDLANQLNPWTVPSIEQIARLDATAIGEALFRDRLGLSDSAVSQNAAWSGTLGFNLLGGQSPYQSWRLMTAGDPGSDQPGRGSLAVANRLDDFKNILFASYAYEKALGAASLAGFRDLGSFLLQGFAQAAGVPPSGPSPQYQAFEAQINISNGSRVWWGLIDDVVEFSPNLVPAVSMIGAHGVERVLDMIRGAYGAESLIGSTSSTTFETRARSFFGGMTPEQLGSIRIELLPTDARTLATRAESEAAVRSALVALSVVAVEPSATAGDRLSLQDPVSGVGTLSKSWLTDRAGMLEVFARTSAAGGITYVDRLAAEVLLYEDKTTGVVVRRSPVSPAGRPIHHVTFGGLANDFVVGSAQADRLYGGGGLDQLNGGDGGDYLEGGDGFDSLYGERGNDTLHGGADGDWLEGGEGNDHLIGGAGIDVYRFTDTFGRDVVLDSDGQGEIHIGGTPVAGGKRVTGGAEQWISTDGLTLFTQVAQAGGAKDLVISRRTAPNSATLAGTITVRNWSNGQLGIGLEEAAPAPPPANTFSGGFIKRVDALTGRYERDGNGNYVSAGADPSSQDLIFDTQADDKLAGGDGNDALLGDIGNDLLEGGAGADLLLGGIGRDTLLGGAGDDYLHGSGLYSFVIPARVTSPPPVAIGTELARGFGWVVYDPTGLDANGMNTYTINEFADQAAVDEDNFIDGGVDATDPRAGRRGGHSRGGDREQGHRLRHRRPGRRAEGRDLQHHPLRHRAGHGDPGGAGCGERWAARRHVPGHAAAGARGH